MTRRLFQRLPVVVAIVITAWSHGAPVRVSAQAGQAPQAVLKPGGDVSDPVLLRSVDPEYTEAARQARIEGRVWLEAVIEVDGTVGEVTVVRSLDRSFGLDDAAIAAARKWRFKPSIRHGTPVPVRVTLILEFNLGPGPGTWFPPPPASEADFVRDAVWGSVTTGLSQPSPIGTCDAARPPGVTRANVDVTVQAVVDIDGRVIRVRPASSANPGDGFVTAALQAALRCRFRPGVLNGRTVPVVVSMQFAFR